MSKPIDRRSDVIDSREVIDRIDYLEGFDAADLEPKEGTELAELRALAKDASGENRDWPYGASLISDDYFTEYIRDYYVEVNDAADHPVDFSAAPFNHIDWDAVAEEVKSDYAEITYAGHSFWTLSQ